jgi:DNA-binding NarL/FixJ family response regulator
MERHTILIADDHGLVRSGIRQIIETTDDLCVCAEACDGAELLAHLNYRHTDLVLLDMAMPGLNGVDLLRRIKAEHPQLPVLVVSMHNEGQIVSRALKAGAAGYVTKDCNPEMLLEALRKVLAGGRYIDPSLVDSVVFHAEQSDQASLDQLSPRELQILELIAGGMALGDIADRLHLSPKTVSTHKMRLMHKLNLENNAELLKYAVRHGLTSA